MPAGIYVVDRLQMVTKFVVVALTYSSAMPILYGVVVAVAFTAKFLDRYNVLRVLIDMQTDESVVRAIFRFVLPIAIVMHCYTASTLFDDLHTGTDIMTNYTVYEAFSPFKKVVRRTPARRRRRCSPPATSRRRRRRSRSTRARRT